MGTWDTGPFDNDTAADFCGDLDEAAADEREGMIRSALTRVIDTENYLEAPESDVAVAAAALVAAQCPQGPATGSVYGPKEPLPDLASLRDLALQALDRVMTEPSELLEIWDGTQGRAWRAEIHRLQNGLLPQPLENSSDWSEQPADTVRPPLEGRHELGRALAPPARRHHLGPATPRCIRVGSARPPGRCPCGHHVCRPRNQPFRSHRGEILGPTWSMELNIGSDDPVDSIMLHIRGSGDDVLTAVFRLAEVLHCKVLDCAEGKLTTPRQTSGWHAFQQYRDHAIGMNPRAVSDPGTSLHP